MQRSEEIIKNLSLALAQVHECDIRRIDDQHILIKLIKNSTTKVLRTQTLIKRLFFCTEFFNHHHYFEKKLKIEFV